MPQLDILEIGASSIFFTFIVYALALSFPEDSADVEDEIEISYLGLRAIQYFEMLRSCVLFYNLNYYNASKNAVLSLKDSKLFCVPFFFFTSDLFFNSPLEQFLTDDIFLLSFSTLFAATVCVLFDGHDYSSNSFFSIIGELMDGVVESASTSLLGCWHQDFSDLFLILFVNILMANFSGLIPFTVTSTVSIEFVFFFAFVGFFSITLLLIVSTKARFTHLFLPAGIPGVLIKFIFLVELVSYVVRLFSLTIRLLANVISGHVLLKMMVGFS
jgi:ATP synthase subunit 6